MSDLGRLLTDERRKKIELLHYLVRHRREGDPVYEEVINLMVRDGKEFIEEVRKELGLKRGKR